MFNQLTNLFPVPTFEEENDARVANLLQAISVALLVAAILVPIPLTLFSGEFNLLAAALPSLFIILGIIVVRILLQQGALAAASFALVGMVFVAVTIAVATSAAGVHSAAVSGYLLVILLSGLLLGTSRQGIYLFSAASIVALIAFFLAEANGAIQYETAANEGFINTIVFGMVFVLSGLLLRSAVLSLNSALERARSSEQEVETANEELEALNRELEARVAARTRALELSAEIGRRISTILEQRPLVNAVASQLQDAFDYYHVHVYLVDQARQQLRLVGGTGEAAERMVERGHSLSMGQGLVGRAADSNLPVLVPNVADNPNWLANPLLPDTASEVAIPIARGDEVMGVLDVQHNVSEELGQDDVELLQSIANQLAIALQNAGLYEEAQRRVQQEQLINTINQQIQRTTDVESALQVAVRELGRALDNEQVGVRLAAARRSPDA